MTTTLLVVGFAIVFFAAERALPGRELPNSRGWYLRAILLNVCQLGVVVLAGLTWETWLDRYSLFEISHHASPVFQGLLAWFIGTFVFYWWHRARHASKFLWRCLHQIHHSASRIETLTAFYKHPVEMILNSIFISCVLFLFLGASPLAAAWFNVFAAAGEMFYHSNLKTPHWLGYFLQRPEHHSIHHEFNVHTHNFGDITLWDRLFGTFRDTDQFAARCGFNADREQQLFKMVLFDDLK